MTFCFYLVIVAKGAEPMAIRAEDATFIIDACPSIALVAKTTKKMLLAAGWTEDTIGTVADLLPYAAAA